MSTICIDARLYGINHTGIGRYIENLIVNLPASSSDSVCLIVSPEVDSNPKLHKYRRFIARHHPYSYLSQWEIFWILLKIRPRVFHVPHFSIPLLWPGKMVITIHDLIKHQSKGRQTTTRSPWMYWPKYYLYLFVVWFAALRACRIIVPAQYWKTILEKKFPFTRGKVEVTYEGVSGDFSKAAVVSLDVPDHNPYLLYVGNVYPHKNIPVLLDAVKMLSGKVLLYLVCSRSVFTQRVQDLIDSQHLEKYVKFLGRVSDEELVALYQGAHAFVFPSLIEGFGLPGLEAMAAGTPVIAARASCLPEIYEQAALFFDPHSPKDLAEKIDQVLTDPKLRKKLSDAGRRQVKKYSWVKMSTQTWEIYQQELR